MGRHGRAGAAAPREGVAESGDAATAAAAGAELGGPCQRPAQDTDILEKAGEYGEHIYVTIFALSG